MNAKKYFLIGMPASGKSTLGKLLASKIGLPFIDLDHEIVRKKHLGVVVDDIENENEFIETFKIIEKKYLSNKKEIRIRCREFAVSNRGLKDHQWRYANWIEKIDSLQSR